MAGLSVTGKNLMLDALGAVAVFASLHTADPGASGTSELAGGSPAYARKAITWNAAASGNLDNNANPTFDVPAGSTITHFGLWSASSGGTYYGSGALSASEAFTAQGSYTLTDADVPIT